MSMTYDELRAGVAGDAVGVRCRTVLQPLGGPGDKVFPPTYSVPENAETRYATEDRYVPSADGNGGSVAESVVLDSVASQANRLELALLDAIRRADLLAPVNSVDFAQISDLAGFDRISDYEAPHRIFDALLRDSYDGEHLFRNGPTGIAITEARPRDAAGLYHHSPHTLVFGGWDSTGPRGGLGAKYERAITSEIVALGIETGKRTASRIDPVGIELRAGRLYQAPDGTWTLDENEAERDATGKPKLLGAKDGGGQGGREAGRPSQANLGNVTPSIDPRAGGVTAREIIGTTVLSFIQLRRLRFPTRPDGSVLDGQRGQAEAAARTALAALGLTAAALAFEEGFDLRSRCVLVCERPATFEMVTRDGAAIPFDLTGADALKLIAEAADHAAEAGLPWRNGELTLRPAPRLVELIRRSQQLTEAGEAATA
ncbi:MAG: type I-G CRISPR-associated RAMP protein Csb1/Cas7g [Streptosporangiaceae bacterium]